MISNPEIPACQPRYYKTINNSDAANGEVLGVLYCPVLVLCVMLGVDISELGARNRLRGTQVSLHSSSVCCWIHSNLGGELIMKDSR